MNKFFRPGPLSVSRFRFSRKRSGFTLIELLIVIAIILILIAIALPNFLEAQLRARVAKTKGELRSIGIAMEAYYLDWNYYPSFSFPCLGALMSRGARGLTWLTSPNAYIASLPEDPFPGDQGPGGHNFVCPQGPFSYILDGVQTPMLEYRGRLFHPDANGAGVLKTWALYSLGPDTPEAEVRADSNANPVCNNGNPIFTYSPTNGTKSKGDIMKYGGDPAWMGLAVDGCIIADKSKFHSYSKVGQPVNNEIYLQRIPGNL